MDGFLLEVLTGRRWHRDGRTYWTRKAAETEAARLLRTGKAVRVRILSVVVDAAAVASLPLSMEGGHTDEN